MSSFVITPVTQGGDVDFSGLSLAENSYWNGSSGAGGFETGGLYFNNNYDSQWSVWTGWSYSNVRNNTTQGYENQYSAITGGGVNGAGSNYAISFGEGPGDSFIDIQAGHSVRSITVTNSTYAYYVMKDGDPFNFARKFVDSDRFVLKVKGYDSAGGTGAVTGSVDFLLAEGRNILDHWADIDLSSFGSDTKSLGFALSSTDAGIYGINTPAYFALGRVLTAPEPSTTVMVGAAALVVAISARNRRKQGVR